MAKKTEMLPESELNVMLVIWEHGGVASSPEIADYIGYVPTPGALHSYLRRLESKGFLTHLQDKGINVYSALVSLDEYRSRVGDVMLRKLYRGSITTFTASLWDGGTLSREDVSSLRSYLDSVEETGT